jgi:hypothetical protein
MRGAIPPLPNTPSWRGALLSTGTTYSESTRPKDRIWNMPSCEDHMHTKSPYKCVSVLLFMYHMLLYSRES